MLIETLDKALHQHERSAYTNCNVAIAFPQQTGLRNDSPEKAERCHDDEDYVGDDYNGHVAASGTVHARELFAVILGRIHRRVHGYAPSAAVRTWRPRIGAERAGFVAVGFLRLASLFAALMTASA